MAHTQNADFFRQPLAEMIDPRHPLAVLARRLPWAQIEAVVGPAFRLQVGTRLAGAQTPSFRPPVQRAG
ncbi:transposase, partial [Xanthomonas oryzae pv. oryzae]